MKKLLLVTALFTALGINAQTAETVSTGASYANDVYYSLKNGIVKSSPRNNWDIAFQVTSSGSGILTNGGQGTELYVYPNGDTASWSSIDTSGIKTWPVLHNTDTAWEIGAFNVGKKDFDLGWGNYSLITHHVTADSIYCIKLSNGSYKKIWIEKLVSKVYSFKYADLNGSNEVAVTLAKADHPNRNFAYYSLQTNAVVDREAPSTDWDLVFTKYVRMLPSIYGVTGVLGNLGVEIEKVAGVDVAEATYDLGKLSTNISTIGWDWKAYSGSYVIEDSLSYYVKTIAGDLYKVVFTGFGGSSNGDYMFTKELVSAASVHDFSNIKSLGLYPNPVKGIANFTLESNAAELATLSIYSITGQEVLNQKISINTGNNQLSFDVSTLPNGSYVLSLLTNSTVFTERFIVK